MPWTIYSIGDEAYLYQIFQFLSMLNSPGTSLYAQLGLMGALIGLMLVLVQAVSSAGKQMNLGSLAVGICMFMVLFGQSTSVELIDYHTGRTDIVSGVPLGTAMLGTLVSQGGVELTNLFQQGTAVPGQETMAPDYALTALAASRALTDGNICAASNAACPFVKTLTTYWSKCVVPKYNGVGQGTDSSGNPITGWWNGDPSQTQDAIGAIDSENQFVMLTDELNSLNTPSGGGTPVYGQQSTQTCQQVYADIKKASTDQSVLGGLSGMVLAAANQTVDPTTAVSAQITQAETMFSSAYGSLNNSAAAGTSSNNGTVTTALQTAASSAQQLMLNAVAVHAKKDAEISGAISPSDMANAAIIEQAAQERNAKFAAEQSLFARTLQATMTFFEGVTYGLAPFVAFLIPMGAIGAKFLARYLQLLLWIFLWLPLMSFVNLFEIMSVLRQMNALAPARGNGPLIGMVGILQTQYSVGDWIAMGGWLSTSVIGLSGMIVFGSVAAFTSIASAAHGPETIDASAIAPEVVSQAPVMSVGSTFSSSGGAGLMRTGAADITFSAASGLSSQISERHSQVVTELEGLGMSHTRAEGMDYASAKQYVDGVKAGTTSTSGISKGTTATNGASEASADANNTSKQKSATTTAGVSDTLSASVGVEVFGSGAKNTASANIGASLNGAASTGDSRTHTGTEKADLNHQEQTDTRRGASSETTAGVTNTASQSSTNGNSENWSARAEKTLSDMKSLDEMKSEQSSFGASATVSGQQIAEALPQNSAAFNEVRSAVTQLGGGSQYELLNSQLEGQFPDAQQRAAVASMSTLQAMSIDQTRTPEVRAEATQALISGMTAANPEVGSSMSSSATSFLNDSGSRQSISQQVSSVGSKVDSSTSASSSLSLGGHPSSGGLNSSIENTVNQQVDNGAQRVRDLHTAGESAVNADGTSDLSQKAEAREAAHDRGLASVVFKGVAPPGN